LSQLSSLVGVSVVVSIISSLIIYRIAIHRLHHESQKVFADKVADCRLQVYPTLMTELSAFIKRIKWGRDIDHGTLEAFWDRFTELDSTHTLFFSTYSADQLNKFNTEIHQILHNGHPFISLDQPMNQATKDRLKTLFLKCENELKRDIAVNATDRLIQYATTT
jgi:hypothetical protein